MRTIRTVLSPFPSLLLHHLRWLNLAHLPYLVADGEEGNGEDNEDAANALIAGIESKQAEMSDLEDQLAAAITSIGAILFMVVIGYVNTMTDANGNAIISSYPVRFVLDWISVSSRFANFGYGIFDFAAVVYYFSIAGVFIFLTIRIYDRRRWS